MVIAFWFCFVLLCLVALLFCLRSPSSCSAITLSISPVCHAVRSCFSRVGLFETPWTIAGQAPLSLGFSRQKYWGGWYFLLQGGLPDPGTETVPFMSPALQVHPLPLTPAGKPHLSRSSFLNTGEGAHWFVYLTLFLPAASCIYWQIQVYLARSVTCHCRNYVCSRRTHASQLNSLQGQVFEFTRSRENFAVA